MSYAAWSIIEDIPPLLGFCTAFIALLVIPVRPGGTFSRAAKAFFGGAIASYIISTAASVMTETSVFPPGLQSVVRSIESLWLPLILFGVYALYSHQQLNDAHASRRAVKRAGEMLESIVETTPAGILVLNDVGQITFANGEARRLLDIEDEAAAFADPQWTVCLGEEADGSKDGRCDFRELLAPDPLADELMTVRWPNGWRRRLTVNTAPFSDEDGNVTGGVAAFIERDPWSPRLR